MRKPLQSSAGFTFVEALVVLAIFVSMIVSVSGVFLMAYRAQSQSYDLELDEQSNMRASFELENLFRASVGYELVAPSALASLYSGGISPPLVSSVISLMVPKLDDSATEVWGFQFVPSGTDSSGRAKGSIVITLPTGATYVFTDRAVLPAGRSTLFELDELGRVDYHWVSPTTGSELDWWGKLSLYQ